jgi:hypothetical protein
MEVLGLCIDLSQVGTGASTVLVPSCVNYNKTLT